MKYRADVQGLRALAVVPVVLNHADDRLISGGYVGVDIFFVISGFLITSILMGELEAGRYSIVGFYRRRMRRLFPALFVMLAAASVAAFYLLPPRGLREFAATAGATIFFSSNFAFWRLSDYFAGAASLKPLLHTWSLAVEEQFYIVFPLILALLWSRARRWLVPALFVCAAGSLALSIWVLGKSPSAAFYFAPTRAYELLIGSLVACGAFPAWRSQGARDAASIGGLALIVGCMAVYNDYTPFPGLAALWPCLGAALIIHAGREAPSAAGRLLSLPVLTFFGAISYSLYLWHWPALVFSRHFFLGDMTPLRTALVVVASVGLAALSWRFVERPFLNPDRAGRAPLRRGLVAMAAGSLAAMAVYLGQGLPERFSPEARALFASANDYNLRREACHSGDDAPIPYGRSCVYGRAGAAPDMAVWGDSHGAELVVALGERRAAAGGGSVMQLTASSCPPALDYDRPKRPNCMAYNRATFDHLRRDGRIKTVIMVADFEGFGSEESWRPMERGFSKAAKGLVASGKRVVLVYPTPVFAYDGPSALGLLTAWGGRPETFGLSRAQFDQSNRRATAMLDALRRRFGLEAIVPAQALCRRGLCRAYEPGAGSLYFNRNHLSLTGARRVMQAAPLDIVSPSKAGRRAEAKAGGLVAI